MNKFNQILHEINTLSSLTLCCSSLNEQGVANAFDEMKKRMVKVAEIIHQHLEALEPSDVSSTMNKAEANLLLNVTNALGDYYKYVNNVENN